MRGGRRFFYFLQIWCRNKLQLLCCAVNFNQPLRRYWQLWDGEVHLPFAAFYTCALRMLFLDSFCRAEIQIVSGRTFWASLSFFRKIVEWKEIEIQVCHHFVIHLLIRSYFIIIILSCLIWGNLRQANERCVYIELLEHLVVFPHLFRIKLVFVFSNSHLWRKCNNISYNYELKTNI